MTFRGWPESALEFYDGLEADNSKAYWQAHKEAYEASVLAPMNALLIELADEFGEARIFRPYRDVRFSADKSPYKTAIGARLSKGGYVQLSARGLAAAAGYYDLAPDQLERYRGAVADDETGEQLRGIVEDVQAKGNEILAHDSLKTAPRGYDKEHPRVDLLRYKNLTVWRQWPASDWLATPEAKEHVVALLRDARPLVRWLGDHVGPSVSPRPR